jgi:sterol desaturase/sphingolipid hydroxylase (fatty acid hydroxylase superfamily)
MGLAEATAAAIFTYYGASFVQAVSHRLFGHTNRLEAVFESHALGHHGIYSVDSLLLDRWKAAEHHVMWYFALLFAPFVLTAYVFAPLHVFLAHLLGLAFAVWWHVFLHKHYHLRGSPFERFRWFQHKRQLHFVHHRQVHKNYAIVEFWLDRLMGTIEKPNHRFLTDAFRAAKPGR